MLCSTDSRSGRRSQRERQSAAGHNSWNRMPVLFFLSLRIRHVFSLSIFISVADPQERKGRENSQPWKSSPRTLGLSSLKRVLVSTVNSCSTFQSWDWWCTKGKGKVNRCINLIWKVKNNYPIIPGSGKGKYMRIQGQEWWEHESFPFFGESSAHGRLLKGKVADWQQLLFHNWVHRETESSFVTYGPICEGMML